MVYVWVEGVWCLLSAVTLHVCGVRLSVVCVVVVAHVVLHCVVEWRWRGGVCSSRRLSSPSSSSPSLCWCSG